MSYFKSPSAIGLTILSAAVFVFEITLSRIFAIQQFHHFAFIVVSLAVLGFAASGLLLSIKSKRLNLAWISAGFSFWIVAAYLIINQLPFDSYSIAWDQTQIWILLLYFTVAGLPFLFAGWTIGAQLSHSGVEAYQPYAANLIGSSLGCLLALGLIQMLGAEKTILLSALMGLVAGAFFSSSRRTRIFFSVGLTAMAIFTFWMPAIFQLQLSPYKPLSIVRHAPDVSQTHTFWSSSSRMDVVETDSVHVLPGLSLNAAIIPPKQIALYIDGDGPLPITNLSPDDPVSENVAKHMPSSLAYLLRPHARTLILQPGSGLEAIQALASGVDHVTLAEDDPLLFELLKNEFLQYSHSLLLDPRITLSARTSRGTLDAAGETYDVITFALVDGFRPVTSGAFSLTENYILTVESFSRAFEQLSPDGLLVITRWLSTPPAESARAWSTVLASLENHGLEDPAIHLIAYRSMRTGTMIAGKQPFTAEELSNVRDFLKLNAYDPIFLPDLDPSELNQYNQLPQDVYHTLFHELITDHEAVLAEYPYDIRPPTDDHPFFFHFFKWSQTPEVIATLGLIWQPFGGSGYLVLLALLGLMIILAIPLAVAPRFLLVRFRQSTIRLGWRFPTYFACLGAGYLLVEIALIQKFILLLDRPSIALAAVLFSILLASGFGSLFSKRIPLRATLLILSAYLIVLALSLPRLISIVLPANELLRFMFCFMMIAPAGFLMGIPFVKGLRTLEIHSPGSIPWAWSINGAISGISGVIAAIIGLEWGLKMTLFLGVLVYLLAFFAAPKSQDPVIAETSSTYQKP